MRRHAPMWETELRGDNSVSDFDVYLRRSLDDAGMLEQSEYSSRPSWFQLLLFLAVAAIFMAVILSWKPGG